MAAGYARTLASARVRQEISKPLLGKAYIKFGQSYAMAGYFMQLGALLGSKHRQNPDEFVTSFLGMTGEPGAALKFFNLSRDSVMSVVDQSETFADYVGLDQIERLGFGGSIAELFMSKGDARLSPETAIDLAWQYAEAGAIVGVNAPEATQRLFDGSNRAHDPQKWLEMRTAGLDIPAEQDVVSYDEVLEGENEIFLAYCREVLPDHYSILSR